METSARRGALTAALGGGLLRGTELSSRFPSCIAEPAQKGSAACPGCWWHLGQGMPCAGLLQAL